MNFVEPIRGLKKIAQIKNLLRGERRYRDLLLFVVRINTALRISDLLRLQIVHFLDEQKQIKKTFGSKSGNEANVMRFSSTKVSPTLSDIWGLRTMSYRLILPRSYLTSIVFFCNI